MGWEDPLEKEMAIHSSIIAWKIPWTEEPGRLQSMESRRVEYDLVTKEHLIDEKGTAVDFCIISQARYGSHAGNN